MKFDNGEATDLSSRIRESVTIGEPPVQVLHPLMALAGPRPAHLVASYADDEPATWQIVALSDDILTLVHATASASRGWTRAAEEFLEALRALTYRACDLYVQGQDVLELASMAKLKAGRLNRMVPDTCLQFWGGMGYTWENKVSRMFRDGRLASIGGGADEVMMGILSKIMGIAKRPAK